MNRFILAFNQILEHQYLPITNHNIYISIVTLVTEKSTTGNLSVSYNERKLNNTMEEI